MVELSTVYNNTHKFLREKMANDFKNYQTKNNDNEIFSKVQAIVFASLSEKEPQKNKNTLIELIDVYSKDAEFKALVDKALDHVKEQYKGQTLQFVDGKKVDLERYVNFTKKQLDAGKIDYAGRLNYLSKELNTEETL